MSIKMSLPDVEQRHATEDKVSPLVAADNQRADKAANDEHPSHEHGGEDVGEREAGGEEELKEEKRQRDEPLDVANELLKYSINIGLDGRR